MVTVLKRRLALVALVGVLVIPILSVNNQGLSHLLFCEATVEEQFAIGALEEGDDPPPITSSTSLDADQPDVEFEGAEEIAAVCAGVRASVSAVPVGADRVQLTVTIINDSELPWQGSVGLAAEGDRNADLTAVLGEVPAGAEESATIELRVLPGQTEINGTLLLGP